MPSRPQLVLAVCGTLLLSAAGGLLFEWLGIPVSWLSGGLIAVAAAALLGAPVLVPARLRDLVFFVIGLSMGGAVTPESLKSIGTWPLSILGMIVTVVLITASSYSILRWRGGWSRKGALLASVPGALALIVALTESVKQEAGRIVLVQSLRVSLLVLTLPPLLDALMPSGVAMDVSARPATFEPVQFAIMAVGGLAGVLVWRLIRMPNPALLGALLGSATLHASGQIAVAVPGWLVVAALICMGAVVGARFRGVDLATLRRSLADGLLSFAAVLVLSLGAAAVAAEMLGFSLGQTALAFAPGGFDVMMVMAFALGVDPAYVAAHHLVRFLGLSILLPLCLGRDTRR